MDPNSKEEFYSPTKTQHQILKMRSLEEEKRANSGIYPNRGEPMNEVEKVDFQLNKTVGGNSDKIKFGIQQKSPYGY